MDIIYLDDVAALQLSLQILKAFSGDKLYRYYKLLKEPYPFCSRVLSETLGQIWGTKYSSAL
jgi:hypothetical protein